MLRVLCKLCGADQSFSSFSCQVRDEEYFLFRVWQAAVWSSRWLLGDRVGAFRFGGGVFAFV